MSNREHKKADEEDEDIPDYEPELLQEYLSGKKEIPIDDDDDTDTDIKITSERSAGYIPPDASIYTIEEERPQTPVSVSSGPSSTDVDGLDPQREKDWSRRPSLQLREKQRDPLRRGFPQRIEEKDEEGSEISSMSRSSASSDSVQFIKHQKPEKSQKKDENIIQYVESKSPPAVEYIKTVKPEDKEPRINESSKSVEYLGMNKKSQDSSSIKEVEYVSSVPSTSSRNRSVRYIEKPTTEEEKRKEEEIDKFFSMTPGYINLVSGDDLSHKKSAMTLSQREKLQTIPEDLKSLDSSTMTEENEFIGDVEKKYTNYEQEECAIANLFHDISLSKYAKKGNKFKPCVPNNLLHETIHNEPINIESEGNRLVPKFHLCDYIDSISLGSMESDTPQLFKGHRIYICNHPLYSNRTIIVFYIIFEVVGPYVQGPAKERNNEAEVDMLNTARYNLNRESLFIHNGVHKIYPKGTPNCYSYYNFYKYMKNKTRHVFYIVQDNAADGEYIVMDNKKNSTLQKVLQGFNILQFPCWKYDPNRYCIDIEFFHKVFLNRGNPVTHKENQCIRKSSTFFALNLWYNSAVYIRNFFAEFFKVMFKFHKNGYFHHDLHGGNVFLKVYPNKKFSIKLIDWGNGSTLLESLQNYEEAIDKDEYYLDYEVKFLKKYVLKFKKELLLAVKDKMPWNRDLVKALFLIELYQDPNLYKRQGLDEDTIYKFQFFHSILTNYKKTHYNKHCRHEHNVFIDFLDYHNLSEREKRRSVIKGASKINVVALQKYTFLLKLFFAEKYCDENNF